MNFREAVAENKKRLIRTALAGAGGKVTAAAAALADRGRRRPRCVWLDGEGDLLVTAVLAPASITPPR